MPPARSRPRPRGRGAQQPQRGAEAVPYAMVALGFVAAIVATWFGFPGLVVVWFATLAASWSVQPPELTGVDANRNPTAQGPREERALKRYNFARSLKWGLVIPYHSVWPGWPVKAAFLGGLLAAAFMFFLPTRDIAAVPDLLFNTISAATAMVLVTQFAAARRDSVEAGDRSPGVDVTALKRLWTNPADNPFKALPRWSRFALVGFGALVGAATGAFILADRFGSNGPFPVVAPVVWGLIGALIGAVAVTGREWVRESLAHWRMVCAARKEWAPSWEMLKQTPGPQLLDRELVGPATVDTFRADGALGSATYFPMGDKILQARGTAQRLAILPVESRDPQGQPMPGTIDPLGFKIVAWPNDFNLSLADPSADPEIAHLWLSCAVSWASAAWGCQPSVDQMNIISAPDAADLVWEVTLHQSNGPGYAELRKSVGGSVAGFVNAEVLVDHRPPSSSKKAGNVMFIGNLTGGPEFAEGANVTAEELIHLQAEDEWNVRWAAVLKQDVNPPTYNPGSSQAESLVNGIEVKRQAFVTRNGVDPRDFFGLENKVKATLSGAPFVAIAGWHNRNRPGERHNQAFAVYWSHQAVPSCPDKLAPPAPRAPAGGDGPRRGPRLGGEDSGEGPARRRGPRPGVEEGAGDGTPRRPRGGAPRRPAGPPPKLDSQQWVLAGILNDAFKAARLARPELYRVRCLTEPSSRAGHIWAMHVRLYDGVTLADVRGAMSRLRGDMGSEWLRVEEAADGCTIVAGASPNKAKIATEADVKWVASLDWEKAFMDAKVVGVGGITPTLIKVERLPNNDQVQVIDFDLPTGLAFVDVKAQTKKLETASANAFVEIRRHESGRAGLFTMLASEVNPMPERAGFDFDKALTGDHKIPFSTNLFGEPTSYDNKTDPMLLVVGGAGGGKSVLLQNLIYGAIARDWDLWIGDPAKGAVDFNFAEPWARATAKTMWEVKGMIEAIYAEVMRRKAINSQYNCGNYRDLPDEVRYNHTLIVLDEFTSMMLPEPVPKALDDSPETLAAVESAKAINGARAFIGSYVGKIVREARSTGFTMLLATQALKADTLSKIPGANDLKDNMSRAIMGRASFGQLQAALKMPTEAPEQPDYLPPGRGLYEGNGRPAEVIQCWFEGSQQAFSSHLLQLRPPIEDGTRLDLARFVEPELEVEGSVMGPVPSFTPVAEDKTEVIELGAMSLSLDDLLDEAEAEDEVSAAAAGIQIVYSEDPAPGPAVADEPQPDWLREVAEFEAGQADDDDPFGDAKLEVVVPEPIFTPNENSTEPNDDESSPVRPHENWAEIDPTPWLPAETEYEWAEIDAFEGFLSQFPQVTEITWLDETLLMRNSLDITFLEIVEDIAEGRGVKFNGPTPTVPPPSPPAPSPLSVPVPPEPRNALVPAAQETVQPPPAPVKSEQRSKSPHTDFDDEELTPKFAPAVPLHDEEF